MGRGGIWYRALNKGGVLLGVRKDATASEIKPSNIHGG